ncbi:MAG: hypothetical protein K8S16_18235, partial [Bacteroidales bacterium]|nr:hypothetical protein [Bacteroidales bacterium]
MKKLFLISIAFLTILSTFAQKWEMIFGEPNQNESSNRLIEHYDKGYVITGSITDGYNDSHGWIIKTDINGNELWNKVIGIDTDQVIITKTIFDNEGNLYIFGLLWQDLPHEYPVLVKLNACGEKQWCKLLGFTEYEFGYFIDGIFLDNSDLLGLASMPDDDQHDMIYLFRITPEGDYVWKKSYASKDNYPYFAMRLGSRIQKFNDIYIISGYVYSPYPGGNPYHVFQRPMFIGIDTLFNEQWVLEFGIADSLIGKALISTPINDTLFMGVGIYKHSGLYDAWAMYYNKEGEEVGYKIFTEDMFAPDIEKTAFYDVQRVNDSLFLAASGFCYEGNNDRITGEMVFDTAGNVSKYEIRDGIKNGTRHLMKTFDGKYVIATSSLDNNLNRDIYFYKINEDLEHDTVYSGSYTYDSLCTNLPIQSGVIDLAGCDIITGLEEIPSLEDYNNRKNTILKVYPNPA